MNARAPTAGPAAPPLDADEAARRESRVGLLYGLAAYGWWGLLPLYLALLKHVPPLVLISHRVLWSVLFLAAILTVQRRWREVVAAARSPRMLGLLTVGSLLIGINWYVFIYAVTIDQVLQGSLGYYINPLISVLLGMVVLRERLRPGQWVSVALAAAGVAAMAVGASAFPWIALTLAVTFALYGLLRKLIPVGPMIGLLVETAVLAPAALLLLIALPAGDPRTMTAGTLALISLSGIATALPLLWFANAARRLRLATLGFLQYLAPSVQFGVAVLVLGEPLDPRKLLSFVFIWLALAVFTVESLRAHRAGAAPPVVEMAE